MTAIQSIVERYLAVFNGDEPQTRMTAIREIFADDASYTDPHISLRGAHAIAGFVSDLRVRLPGARFALAGAIDSHHDQARFRWQVEVPSSPDPIASGFDVITVAAGRIRSVYGFIDRGRSHDLQA
ncbi:MAG: nuclear transport factor 2 family protein, partial [Deltaproteobacteria bacterium]|nr:nuclear transport factor 2 family protein [Nannocystaceae bacterium]